MKLFKLMFLLILTVAVSAYGETSSIDGKAPPSEDNSATISGRVVIKGKTPMLFGIVLLYDQANGPPPSNRYWRVPDMITGTDDNGRFSIQVPPGTYYLQIAQKKPDGEIGP